MNTKILALLLTLALIFSLASCTKAEETKEAKNPSETQNNTEVSAIPAEGLWKDAIYRKNKTFGNGAKTITVRVEAGEYYLDFTINTDKNNLEEALLEHKLVEGENSEFGLYIKKVNGILADYDVDQTYWSFEIDGVAQMTGVNGAEIKGGESFELVRKK